MTRLLSAAHRTLTPAVRAVKRSSVMTRMLFGVTVPESQDAPMFDTTTIALARFLRRHGQPAERILEVGVGEGALLLAVAASTGAKAALHGVDISEDRVTSARTFARANAPQAEVWQSDLFAEVDGRYDLIVSNPPYVPTEVGERLELTRRHAFDGDHVWDGGHDGLDLIRRLLVEGPAHLSRGGRLAIGVQPVHIKTEAIRAVADDARVTHLAEVRFRLIPSTVHVFAPEP